MTGLMKTASRGLLEGRWLLEEKPAHHPLEPLDVALKHTGWMPPAYLYSLAESAKVEGKRIVNSDIN